MQEEFHFNFKFSAHTHTHMHTRAGQTTGHISWHNKLKLQKSISILVGNILEFRVAQAATSVSGGIGN